MNILLVALSVLLLSAAPAAADPVSTAIALIANGASFGAAITATFGAWALTALKLGAGLLLSAIAKAKLRQPEVRTGIKTTATLSGGANSHSFILGRYATAGTLVCPPLTYDSRLHLMNYVIDLGPSGQTIEKMFVNGEPAPLLAVSPDGFQRVPGTFYDGKLATRTLDGTQTVADPFLRSQNGSHPDFPWEEDMIGRGRLISVTQFSISASDPAWAGLPAVRYEIMGLPLYDPRKDSTAGGSGAHRWANPATWQPTENPAVMIYNILRGITLPDGSMWGGGVDAEDLPDSVWFAAMNACDETVTVGSGSELRYRAGVEIRVADDEPAQVIEELLAACSGDIAEEGGSWYINVGEPALPVYFFTDDDMIVSDPTEYDPFPGLEGTVNGVSITHPDPNANWESTTAPLRLDAGYVDEDGRELIEGLSIPACPYPMQIQRLALAFLQDARKFRTHTLSLPPDAAHIPPLSTVSWSSDHNGYDAKLFEVERKSVDLRSLITQFAVRERDPADYDWSPSFALQYEAVPNSVTQPTDFVPDELVATGISLIDAGGTSRRPAVRVDGFQVEPDERSERPIEYRLRRSGAVVSSGSAVLSGTFVIIVDAALIPETAYEIQVRFTGVKEAWSAWLSFTTTDVTLQDPTAPPLDTVPPEQVTGLTATGAFEAAWLKWNPVSDDDLNYYEIYESDTTTAPTGGTEASFTSTATTFVRAALPVEATTKNYWVRAVDFSGNLGPWSTRATATTTAVVTNVTVEDLAGIIDATSFATSIKPIEVLGSLPGTPHVEGRVVFLTTDNKMYRNTGSGWTAAVPAADVTGTLTSAQISTLDAAKLTGLIAATRITDGSISTPKIATGAVTANEVAANAITAGKIASSAITTDKLAANSITSAKIAANQVTATQIAANTITAGQIATGAIGADQIAARAIIASKIGVTDLENLWPDGTWQSQDESLFSAIGTSVYTLWGTQSLTGATSLIVGKDTLSESVSAVLNTEYAIPVEGGATYWGETWARSNTNTGAGFYYRVLWFDEAKSALASPYNYTDIVNNAGLTTDFQRFDSQITAPSGARYATWRIYNHSTNTAANGFHIDRLVLRRANAAELIVDGTIKANHIDTPSLVTNLATINTAYIKDANVSGTINGNKITANTITATQIAGTTITAGQIASNAITAGKIAAGAVNTSHLTVSMGARNLIPDPRFLTDNAYREIGTGGLSSQTTVGIRPTSSSWSAPEKPTLVMQQTGTASDGYVDCRFAGITPDGIVTTTPMAVRGSQWHEFSVQLSLHRTGVRLFIGWVAADGSVTYDFEEIPSGPTSSSTNPDEWPRYHIRGLSPSWATGATVFVRHLGTTSGSDSYTFIYKPMFAETHQGTPSPIPFNDGLATTIDGGMIKTGAIQSTNFVSGSTGWSIDKSGTAQFNNLIVRNSLQVGAVSEKYTLANESIFNIDQGEQGLITSILPQPDYNNTVWVFATRGSSRSFYDYANPGLPGSQPTTQVRYRTSSGAAWSVWIDVAAAFPPREKTGGTGFYDVDNLYFSSGIFNQPGSDVQFRVIEPKDNARWYSINFTALAVMR